MNSTPPIRSWNQMSPRAQAVWGAAYATHPTPGREAAEHADRVANSLASFEIPEKESPEHRAARLLTGITLPEFRAWYLVERQLAPLSRHAHVTEDDINTAFETYVMCSCDFH